MHVARLGLRSHSHQETVGPRLKLTSRAYDSPLPHPATYRNLLMSYLYSVKFPTSYWRFVVYSYFTKQLIIVLVSCVAFITLIFQADILNTPDTPVSHLYQVTNSWSNSSLASPLPPATFRNPGFLSLCQPRRITQNILENSDHDFGQNRAYSHTSYLWLYDSIFILLFHGLSVLSSYCYW